MKKLSKLGLMSVAALTMAACSSGKSAEPAVSNVSIGITGYEFGPSVNKVIVELDQAISSVDSGSAKVTTADAERKIEKAYVSDEKGNALKEGEESKYVTLELAVSFDSEKNYSPGSPFTFSMETFQNSWSEEYKVELSGLTVKSKDSEATLETEVDAIDNRVSNDSAVFANRGTFSGTYKNDSTKKDEEVTLNYAAFEPDSLKDGDKNPLVIWLHGAGEGGDDSDITLLGNEVTALARDDIQSHFTAGDQTGAYVLTLQTKTYWMDEGDGTNGPGAGLSRYTDAAMDAIKEYVDNNPDVDTDRIYLSGCSNGGYMTLNLAITNPGYFAALVPQSAAYSYYDYERNEDGTYKEVDSETSFSGKEKVPTEEVYFDDEKLAAIKDTPIWFIHSADDTTVDPTKYSLPIYKDLVDSGATNKWFSYYESLEGADIPGITYQGHWSWIYFFNDQVTGVQDVDSIKAADDLSAFKASNETKGGSATAEVDGQSYNNIYDWLNAQSK
jgi:predicted peptidase